jgi:hypothetical protein
VELARRFGKAAVRRDWTEVVLAKPAYTGDVRADKTGTRDWTNVALVRPDCASIIEQGLFAVETGRIRTPGSHEARRDWTEVVLVKRPAKAEVLRRD